MIQMQTGSVLRKGESAAGSCVNKEEMKTNGKGILNEDELNEIDGGQQGRRKRRHNNKCPRCNAFARSMTASIEGIGVKQVYSCHTCCLKWIARDSFGNNPFEYHMVSYMPEGENYKDLGMYKW